MDLALTSGKRPINRETVQVGLGAARARWKMRLENEANMMWGKPPFTIADNCAVDVRSVAAAREWYKEKLGLRDAQNDREEDSGRPFVDLHISDDDTFLSLAELEPGASVKNRHVIFFTRNLEKAHQWKLCGG